MGDDVREGEWGVATGNAGETRALAERVGARLAAGDVVLLEGDLGAGKTTFVQGLAAGLGIAQPVTSPTFTLIHEYSGGRLPLYHLDPYRLSDPEQVLELGFDEYLERGGVVVVEWAERLGPLAPADHLCVTLEAVGEEARRVTLHAAGARYVALIAELRTA